jgi:hypothetical protein
MVNNHRLVTRTETEAVHYALKLSSDSTHKYHGDISLHD